MTVQLGWPRLLAALAVPGLGFALRRNWALAAWTLYAVAHLLALAWADSTAIVQRFETHDLVPALAVTWTPVRFGPQAVWALALAGAVHVLAAWASARQPVTPTTE